VKRKHVNDEEVLTLPRGKELEQLPMANTLPGAGKDSSKMNRTELIGMTEGARPNPANTSKKINNSN
jgi:hypothetical protein